jgi:hypothetical protein
MLRAVARNIRVTALFIILLFGLIGYGDGCVLDRRFPANYNRENMDFTGCSEWKYDSVHANKKMRG